MYTSLSLLFHAGLIYLWTGYCVQRTRWKIRLTSLTFIVSYVQTLTVVLVLAILFGTPLTEVTIPWGLVHSMQISCLSAVGGLTESTAWWLAKAITEIHQQQMQPKEAGLPYERKRWTKGFSRAPIVVSCSSGLVGAWFGAVFTPLDWDKWWQFWPYNTLFGSAAITAILFPYVTLRILVRNQTWMSTNSGGVSNLDGESDKNLNKRNRRSPYLFDV